MSINDLREALATYKDLMALTPRDQSIVKNLAEISTKLGNSNDAMMYLTKICGAGADRCRGAAGPWKPAL
jgi:predicted Zn-dependent protease